MSNSVSVDSYDFGSISVGGEIYREDIIIAGEKVISGWWRKEGHLLLPGDLARVWEYGPEILIIGSGAYGVMKISKEAKDTCNERNIDLAVFKTGRAVREYNKICSTRKTAAGFHLTC